MTGHIAVCGFSQLRAMQSDAEVALTSLPIYFGYLHHNSDSQCI